MDDRTITVVQFPPAERNQPASFISLLQAATASEGIRSGSADRLSVRWALRHAGADVVHLHWLEYIVSVDGRPGAGLARTLVRTARLLLGLLVLRTRRIGIVWSVHNLMPHEAVRPRVQRFVAMATYLLADHVIVHSEYARGRVQEVLGRLRRPPVHVIPHANYVGVYPAATQSREAVRERLGLPGDAYVYLCFGQVRGYKRLAALAERFRTLAAEDVALLIVGRAVDQEETARLQTHATEDPRIVLRLGHVPDDMVAAIHKASDVAVLAYADVFSSGALLLALSYGVPVVAPGSGTARELFRPPALEFFGDADDLLDALERVRRHHTPQQARAALHAALEFPWSSAGRMTAQVYRLACRER